MLPKLLTIGTFFASIALLTHDISTTIATLITHRRSLIVGGRIIEEVQIQARNVSVDPRDKLLSDKHHITGSHVVQLVRRLVVLDSLSDNLLTLFCKLLQGQVLTHSLFLAHIVSFLPTLGGILVLGLSGLLASRLHLFFGLGLYFL